MSGALLFPLAGTGAHVVRFVLKYRYERHDSPLRTIVAFAMPGGVEHVPDSECEKEHIAGYVLACVEIARSRACSRLVD